MPTLRRSTPRFSLVADDAPATQTVQFYDGFFPQLKAGSYTLQVSHVVNGGRGGYSSYRPAAQPFSVRGPEFTIEPDCVQSTYPASGGSDAYGQVFPSLVITDSTLPWERALVPRDEAPSGGSGVPWLALMIFQEGEIVLDAGSATTTLTVAKLLAADGDTLKPDLPEGWVSADVLASSCQAVTITGAAFNALMPTKGDLLYLAHCRQIDTDTEDPVLLSVIISNRLAVASGSTPVKYYAHLVSLEGLAAYLGPDATPIPDGKSGLMNVMMASLFDWSFVSMPAPAVSFSALVQGLIQSQRASAGLGLPVPAPGGSLPTSVTDRIAEGYVALDWLTGSAEQSFAWYRGPLSPVVPQPLPAVGSPPVPVAQASTSDALMIYLADQGLFDMSYASAFQLGRTLALSDGTFCQEVQTMNNGAKSSLSLMTQRAALPHLAGLSPEELLRASPTRRGFARSMGQGLCDRWRAAVSAARDPEARSTAAPRRPGRALPGAAAMRRMLADPRAQAALASSASLASSPVTDWLANLTLLVPIPFSHMVPDARMLPQESIRFFYVDQGWLDALSAGALSVAVQGSADVAIQRALHAPLSQAVRARRAARSRGRRRARSDTSASAADAGTTTPMTGVLLRSQVVAGWPTLVVTASRQGAPLTLARRDQLAPDVLLCLFLGIPDTVAIAEPYQGLNFGVEDNGIALRNVTTAGSIGDQTGSFIPPAPSNSYTELLRLYTRSAGSGVVTVAGLAAALQAALGAGALGAGDYAIQVVRAPELQSFPTS